ncbi:hypothetical protein [Helicobacter felis]|nr:hypothetical protein [Helicobacter felis]
MDSYEEFEKAMNEAKLLLTIGFSAHQSEDHEMASEYLQKAGEIYFQTAREAQDNEYY